MDITIHNTDKTVSVADEAFNASFNETLIHQLVTSFMSGARAGTRAQKNRAAASGGGAKPWRQKGTGRARAGTIRSPLWRSGGVTFAANPQDHSKKLNRKMYRVGMRSLVSELIRRERLILIETLGVTEAKTKIMQDKLNELGVK
ncbi:MAG: 50S ribosomal protein L4, partial [Gammaproteobacteria bacterium]|nr:50S ribosomal protein L4 [Gammaproteobacteria bacterium]